jgi:hypothetical protein
MKTKHGEYEISTTEVLSFVARVLGSLPQRIGRIEELAAPLAIAAPRDAALRIALQDLDHIRQTLEDLARLSAAAGRAEARNPVALAATLHLEALRNVFVGSGTTAEAEQNSKPQPGRIQLFADGPDMD